MFSHQRIFLDNAGSLTDASVELNDYVSASKVLGTFDHIYIASEFPFNHRYVEVSTANATSRTMDVEIWDGGNWVNAVDVLDQTNAFQNSGIVSWNTDRRESWSIAFDSSSDITELATINIYDMYWTRISFDAAIDAATALKFIGHKFASDSDLAVYYPDLVRTEVLDSHTSGKTDWDEQHYVAAEEIIEYLRSLNIALSGSQIWDYRQFLLAGIHKVAEVIMAGFGDDFANNRKEAISKFKTSLNKGNLKIDKNRDGRLERWERVKHGNLNRV